MSDPTKHVDDIAELAQEHGFTVGGAESLTGGAGSSALALGSAAADWYHGCVVSYGRAVKEDVLGVTADKLYKLRTYSRTYGREDVERLAALRMISGGRLRYHHLAAVRR